jgi:anti-anti-sigma factor
MEIKIHNEAGHVKIVMSGNLDSIGSGEFQSVTDKIFAESGDADLVLDFASVAFVSSAGLRVLLLLMKKLLSAGRSMKLSNVSEPVRKVLDITGFSSIFTIL